MSKMTTKNLRTEAWSRVKEKYVDSTSQDSNNKITTKVFWLC